ncbi:MAG: transglutaminase family protein [Rhodospirillales bacterium]
MGAVRPPAVGLEPRAGSSRFRHRHITFDYQQARSTRSAWEAYQEGVGVCRDYAHLALTFCRCMNIPARYCTGYMGDIGVPDVPPMDFFRMVRSVYGRQVVDLRRPAQRAAHRAGADGGGTGRYGRRDFQ